MSGYMTSDTRRVGDRGQVTIPKWIREQEGISGGDEVVVERRDGEIVIRKQTEVDDEELAEAYRENANHAREINSEWEGVSREANDSL